MQPPPLSMHTHQSPSSPITIRDGLTWTELCQDPPEWLQPFLDIPEDAAPPLWVSAVHPEAVGSFGPQAIEWMESTLQERGRPLRLRWWQKLAIVLQLQYRENGSLCFRVILESGPRRIGKSVRLRAVALWRLTFGEFMFEPEQLIVHTGKDLAIVREVLKKAFPWAESQPNWSCKKGMTEPEVSYKTTNRWVVRSKDATTGYDCCLALVDEAWDVPPASIDDDLEPSMLERESPQLLLTSTAHRRATSLMRGRIIDVLNVDDGETLILTWGAPMDADPGDPVVWRAASAHWSLEREKLVASKYAKALAGESDPEFDDPDPMEGFKAQYLNQWRLRERKRNKGQEVMSTSAWNALATDLPEGAPGAAAIESWFEQGYSLALAYPHNGRVIVAVTDHPDLTSAATALKASGFRGQVIVGSSMFDDPVLKRVPRKKGEGRTAAVVAQLQRLLVVEKVVGHNGGKHLTEQILQVRTTPGADGPRMASSGRADAIKAAVWAASAVHTESGTAKRKMVLPRSK